MSEDLTQKFPQSDSEKLTLILTTVQALDVRVSNLERRVNSIDTRLLSVERRMQSLEQKFEERLYDTRPMWQKLVADITQLQDGQGRLEVGQRRLEEITNRLAEGQEALRLEVREIKSSLPDVYHRFSVVNDTLLAIQAEHRDIHQRVSRLEAERNPSNSST